MRQKNEWIEFLEVVGAFMRTEIFVVTTCVLFEWVTIICYIEPVTLGERGIKGCLQP